MVYARCIQDFTPQQARQLRLSHQLSLPRLQYMQLTSHPQAGAPTTNRLNLWLFQPLGR